VVGVDIGGTKLAAVALVEERVVGQVRTGAPTAGGEALEAIGGAVADLLGGRAPAALGVGIPGLVDPAGTMRFSPHRPGLVGVPLAAALGAEWPGVPIWVGNDATAAAWAELRLGAGAGCADLLAVTLGTGIGGGIVAGGRLVEGANRFAGEWGHMVLDPHGPPCPCGKQGCWERYASGSGLGRLGREAATAGRAARVVELAGGDPEGVRGEHVTSAAVEGDPEALAVTAGFAWWLALGLANLANIFDPELIVLGGGLVDAGGVLLEPTRGAFGRLVQAADRRRVRIEPAALGSAAGAVGAALLAARAASAG
jgi:glucokinase